MNVNRKLQFSQKLSTIYIKFHKKQLKRCNLYKCSCPSNSNSIKLLWTDVWHISCDWTSHSLSHTQKKKDKEEARVEKESFWKCEYCLFHSPFYSYTDPLFYFLSNLSTTQSSSLISVLLLPYTLFPFFLHSLLFSSPFSLYTFLISPLPYSSKLKTTLFLDFDDKDKPHMDHP